ncbi:MAG: hypothetical protein ACLSVX_02745 [Massilimicrobiota timonensis]
MSVLKEETIKKMYAMEWGIFHIIGPIYIAKKYSPATRGLKGLIWTIDIKKKERRKNDAFR